MADEIRIRSQALADELFEAYTSGDPFNDGAVLGICQRHLSEATAPLRARIEKLETLESLIEQLAGQCIEAGKDRMIGIPADLAFRDGNATLVEIERILKGGAS